MSAESENRARFTAQAVAFLQQGEIHEDRATDERGKQRVFTLISAYGEYQKGALAALNADDDPMTKAAKAASLRVLRAIEPLLAKRKRKKPRGRSVIP